MKVKKMMSPTERAAELTAQIEKLQVLRDQLATASEGITIDIGTTLADVQRRVVTTTYAWCGYNKAQTAEVLGIARRTLYNWLTEWGLMPKDGIEEAAEQTGAEDPAAPQVST